MSKVSGIVHQLLTRRGIAAVLACAATAGTSGAVGVSNAGAVVNNNGLNVAYTLGGTGCRAVVGDEKSSTAAIGEVDVTRCPYYYNIEDWVQLQISSSANGRWSPYTGYVTSGYTYQLDDATAPECGAHYWRTVADVRINGNWSGYMFSKVGYYNTPCR